MNIIIDNENVTLLDINNEVGRIEELISRAEFEEKYSVSLTNIDTLAYEPLRGIFHIQSNNKVEAYVTADENSLLKSIKDISNIFLSDMEDKVLEDNKPSSYHTLVNKKWVITEENALQLAKDKKIATIKTACDNAIVSGFNSSALGSEYFYYSTLEEQSTLNSLISLGADTNFKAQKVNQDNSLEDRIQYPHTIQQLKDVLVDGATYIALQVSNKDDLKVLINSCTTVEEVEAITWESN